MQQAHPIAGMPPGRNYFEVDGGQSYFEVGGDRELMASASEDSESAALTWRGDPMENGSDWTIVVVTDELQTLTFHVHKNVVIYGMRKSKLFSRIMREINKSEKDLRPRSKSPMRAPNQSRKECPTTKIELSQRDVKNFPLVLDFMYATGPGQNGVSGDTITTTPSSLSYQSLRSMPTMDSENSFPFLDNVITTQNAVSLRHIARLLEVESLMIAVNKFIQKDLSFATGPSYLTKAHEYKDERLIFSAQRLCAENIERVEKKALLRLPYPLFREVVKSLESFKDEDKSLSHFISDLVCRYLQKYPKIRSAEIILDLTDPLVMPYIASAAAISYTTLIKDLDPVDVRKHWVPLVRFSRRCAKSVLEEYGWSDFSVNAALDEYLGKMKDIENENDSSIDSLLFATSFAAALEQAQDDYEEIHVEQERMQSIVGSLQQTLTVIERLLLKREEHAERQQEAIISANETIAKLKAEMGELRRQQLQRNQVYKEVSPPRPVRTCIDRASPLRDFVSPSTRAGSDSPHRELVSPSRVGVDVYVNKQRSREELRTRSEMRSRSILSSLSATQDNN